MQYYDYQSVKVFQKEREAEAKRYRMAQQVHKSKRNGRS